MSGTGYNDNVEELGTLMRSMGQAPSAAEVQRMMEEVDDDKSGAIEFDEFVHRPGPPGALKRPQRSLVFSIANQFCMGLLYGRAGRLTALSAVFGPGSDGQDPRRRPGLRHERGRGAGDAAGGPRATHCPSALPLTAIGCRSPGIHAVILLPSRSCSASMTVSPLAAAGGGGQRAGRGGGPAAGAVGGRVGGVDEPRRHEGT